MRSSRAPDRDRGVLPRGRADAETRADHQDRGTGELDRHGLHPEFGPVTLRQLLSTWVVHDLNHTGQIVMTLAKRYREAIGPWRANAPIVDLP
ncbi:MAG: hypothetical protein L0206_18730 [Actinobacteria bacterium]|nr:hypothetical protein [Actinomycetota bacterium]